MSSTRVSAADPSHDVLRSEPNPLDAIFVPHSVAVIGASEREGSVGRTVVENLVKSGFPGSVYGVNPNRREVLGVPTYPSLADLPAAVDLAVVLPENIGMQKIAARMGFALDHASDPRLVMATIDFA